MATIAPVPVRRPFYRHLYVQVLIAIAIGIVLGYASPATAVKMQPSVTGSSS